MPLKIVSFWEGKITWLERLSLATMVSAGHNVDIFTHQVEELKKDLGVTSSKAQIYDVRDILPATPVINMYREHGFYSLYSDIVRLAVLRNGLGTWADLDCIFLRELVMQGDMMMGWSHPGLRINNAVLFLSADSQLLKDYWDAVTTAPVYAPWATYHIRIKRAAGVLFGRSLPSSPQKMSIGPRALTYFVKKHRLQHLVSPKSRFYPLGQEEVDHLMTEDQSYVQMKITNETDIVHAWRGNLSEKGYLKMTEPHPKSFLGEAFLKLFR